MAKKSPICPTHKDNPKRAIAKKKRGYGTLAMGSLTHDKWAQQHDPLFKIGGIERHRKLHVNPLELDE